MAANVCARGVVHSENPSLYFIPHCLWLTLNYAIILRKSPLSHVLVAQLVFTWGQTRQVCAQFVFSVHVARDGRIGLTSEMSAISRNVENVE